MSAKQIGQQPLQKILVRSTNWIGDAVMTTPALAVLRQHYPQAEIVVLANPLVAQLFTYHPAVDQVMVYDKKGVHHGVAGFLKMAKELRAQRFDGAVLLQNAIEAAFLAVFAAIPRRIGYVTDGRRLLLNYPVAVGTTEKSLHHTDYYLKVLAQVGITAGGSSVGGKLCLTCDANEQQWAKNILAGDDTSDNGSENIIAINPGAAYGSAKRWLPERFAEVADELAHSYNATILLTGGPGENEIGADIAAAMSAPVINMVGKTSVRQMMALLEQSSLLITNDSGPMHVAAAFAVPIVAVFGSTDHTTTSPAAENVKIVRKQTDCAPCLLRQCPTDHRCMTAITAKDVIEAARQLLDKIV